MMTPLRDAISPFTPGMPVPPDLFVGRKDHVDAVMGLLGQSAGGRFTASLISGERGIGKSSLAVFAGRLAASDHAMVPVHVFASKTRDLDDLVRTVIERLVAASATEAWGEKVRGIFGGFLSEVGLFGVNLSFNPPADKLAAMRRDFPGLLRGIAEKIAPDRRGLLVIIDDYGKFTGDSEFADWLKGVLDEIATMYEKPFPVALMLVGTDEDRNALLAANESLGRYFMTAQIERLDTADVTDFYSRAFSSVGIEIDEDAMRRMVALTDGAPVIMQEVGNGVFWANDDTTVTLDDATRGFVFAAEQVGMKYLTPKVYDAIRSPRYRSILRKIAMNVDMDFTKHEVEEHLTDGEKAIFHNFLQRMRELGVIATSNKGRGCYTFTHPIYAFYVWSEAVEHAED